MFVLIEECHLRPVIVVNVLHSSSCSIEHWVFLALRKKVDRQVMKQEHRGPRHLEECFDRGVETAGKADVTLN